MTLASIVAAMLTAYQNADMETLKAAVFAGLYLPCNGTLAYQFDLPDDIELALVAGDVSNPRARRGDFVVPRPSMAGLTLPRAEHGL
ncbi:hypothetical protein A7J57_22425 [Agrobacterium tumefaciens]|uniref:Uncharacterized protein n=2 Tax=Agrobacterium tumefaciens TaxID=358 RepID=A0A176XFS7_AGRTU|nr:hypothetical protein A7J57_22425 [Agrobacterium tumefaciens]